MRRNLIKTINQLRCVSEPIRRAVIMLEDLNLATMLLSLVAVVVGGALFGVTWYNLSSRWGRESAPRYTEMSPEDRFRDFWK